MKKIITFFLLSVSVLLVVYWMGMEVAFLYLNHTLALTADVSLLFFTGNMDYFLLLSGIALYFILDIFYNQFIRKSKKGKNRKRSLTLDEHRNYKKLAGLHEAKKGLTRLEFDSTGHLCNVDYSKPEILVGQLIVIYGIRQLLTVIHQLFLFLRSIHQVQGFDWEGDPVFLQRAGSAGRHVLFAMILFVLTGYVFGLFHQNRSAESRSPGAADFLYLAHL